MDDLIDKLATCSSLSQCVNDVNKPHPRLNKFKSGSHLNDQNERREKFLEGQKLKHINYIEHVRKLASNVTKDVNERMDYDNPHTSFGRHRKIDKRFVDQLMIAEWMVEKPKDLESNWTMVPCPVGKRCLVISANGKTQAFGKNGVRLCNPFGSTLPGGASCQRHIAWNECCILDCILDLGLRKYYVLDVMAWGGQVFYDCDTQFRTFWLTSKFSELATKPNPKGFEFVPLPRFGAPLDSAAIVSHLSSPTYTVPLGGGSQTDQANGGMQVSEENLEIVRSFSGDRNDPDLREKKGGFMLDGILFFHNNAHYILPSRCKGDDMDVSFDVSNPLVAWLSIEHLPEILGISLPSNLK